MNPFGNAPTNAAGQRGFYTAQKAKDAALAQPETKTFAVLMCKNEFAWVAPVDIVQQRLGPMMLAGISVVEFGQK
ncbi:MAG: hypothetical protein PHW66_09730 [Gallionella sp.]|nr:hypothetical protein [Gallionella sp.]